MDLIAERVTALGGTAAGTVRMSAAATRLREWWPPLGRIVGRLAPSQPGFVDVELPGKLEPTLFDRYGNWPFLAALALGLVTALVTRTRKPRRA